MNRVEAFDAVLTALDVAGVLDAAPIVSAIHFYRDTLLVERNKMADMTTHEAAAYLAERGYTVKSRRTGESEPPKPDTVKRWALEGKLPGARKRENRWLIPQEAIDELLKADEPPMHRPKHTADDDL